MADLDETPEQKALREEKEHHRMLTLMGGYTAFVAALFIAAIAMNGSYARAWIAASLLAVALPSLTAYIVLDFTVRVKQGRKKSAARGLAAFLGFLPSLAGIVILIWYSSVVAAALFILLTAYWLLRIDRIVYLNPSGGSDM